MILDIAVKFKCSDTLFNLRGERQEMYFVVKRIANEIEEMSFRAGMLYWEWSVWTGGWTQIKTWTYRAGSGIVQGREQRINRGNGLDCLHPWRFAMNKVPAANPMYGVDSIESVLPF